MEAALSRLRELSLAAIAGLLLTGGAALAADTVTLTLKGHQFTPDTVTVPAGQRFRIVLHNQDDTPAELESHDLRIEKVVVPGGTITVSAGPLKPGRYAFFDEYHEETAKGTVVVTEKTAGE